METSEYIEALRREGNLFADAVERTDPAAPVPSCPDWQVRDLAAHLGSMQRWARANMAERRQKIERPEGAPEMSDKELVPWLREGLGLLLETLTTAPADLDCCTFLPAPSPLDFWARRQAQEVSMHRVDAEQAGGIPLSPVDPAFAADGIDELLTGFYPRGNRPLYTEAPRTLRVHATDVPGATWTIDLQDPTRTARTAQPAGEADCDLAGPAAELNLVLWNRLPLNTVNITGDTTLAPLWANVFSP
ncbi:maleylpyruvate isomerase family mycothiol-dependent enzyme [Streptomyces iconiensis]|uniref:Maleylpyruvate isomerase family mycothiol-dependent enzyme n=1 Tax=Streptomyces iconiensis TaxID=1384038 RepID=A0ABT6ZXU5_9ACTN|nr:maleylpyruvate isomerase family mycothiol-dependent enzyme [Streptomyces iconiensis]MDJ1133895.1 maleylpyruvate isomerase family mycothiol-dependent enzyme [Streptomyces iconiensis]